ncbi:MAG: DUF4232 domain-containing protein [Mycobacterium sp.]
MTAVHAALAAAMCMSAVPIGFAARASADEPCDPGALAVTKSPLQPGMGHRAVQLDFTLQSGACQLTGYPTVDAEPQVEGAAPIHAAQTPSGYLGGAVAGGTVTLTPGHGAHAMLEWIGSAPVPDCSTYARPSTDVSLSVTPPGMSQTFTVPIAVGRNEGLCRLQVHPLTGDRT